VANSCFEFSLTPEKLLDRVLLVEEAIALGDEVAGCPWRMVR
jgi:hypothetical protein